MGARTLPFGRWYGAFETSTVLLQVAPPSVETNDITVKPVFVNPLIGTTTLPSRCTTGCPPMPKAPSAVVLGAPQLAPPSLEVLIKIRSPRLALSNSV